MADAYIFSAGPSLRTLPPLPPAPIYGVNRAIMVRPCDYLIAGDYETLRAVGEYRPAKQVWSMKNDAKLPDNWPIPERFDHLPGWNELGIHANWSVQAAIAVAVHHGHRLIEVYGCDLYPLRHEFDPADCSGYAGPLSDRTPERWTRERADIDHSIAWASAHGAHIRMMTT